MTLITHPYIFLAWDLVKHGDKFIFTFIINIIQNNTLDS